MGNRWTPIDTSSRNRSSTSLNTALLRRLLPILLVSSLAACAEGDLTVRLSLHQEELRGVQVEAVPFDPDAILDSLAGTAVDPSPTFSALEEALFAFEPSDHAALAAINEPWLALRDSVAALSESLQAMDRADPAYAVAYGQFRALYAQFTQRTAQRGRELSALDGHGVQLARWAQAAADTLRTWERIAYAAYDSLASAALTTSGREAHTLTTEANGEAHVTLETGMWWLVVRRADVENPFLEYYWHVPVQVNGLVPTVLTLTEHRALLRWRH